MRVVLAYSGGLDTSAILLLLREQGHEVITVTVNVGQEDDMEGVEEKAYKLGAYKHYTINAVKEFAENYVSKAIKANALYEDKYPLGTALARPLIAEKVAEIAKKEGADAVAHGCTSKGNDQVRFDLVLKYYLGDDYKIIAPVRELGLTRAKSAEILRKHGFEPPGAHKKYSIDENLWSRSIEGGELDDPSAEPPEDAFAWTVPPEKAPEEPLVLKVSFRNGIPVAINNEKMDLEKIVKLLNRLLGLHGYGRIDHIENRVVGLKSREVYEAPAALALIESHRDLEKLVYTPKELRFKKLLDQYWSDLVYQGLWVEPLRLVIEKAIDELNKWVSGDVVMKVYKGSLRIIGRSSEYTGYSEKLIDYDTGWYPSAEEAEGFIKIWGLHSLAAAKARGLNNL
ncbi:argininosuccinate synthase [Pyrofollis japonicus]|uniref:argininosuccinate synthase n=1 Tax=Pyrofollis japonicus TaxID=3060460 RepID=UPI0037C92342|nr:argininosuccinate synthase [Pyrofollis japonicus]